MTSQFLGVQRAEEFDQWPKNCDLMLAEPKLDGFRLQAYVVDGEVTFYCRDPEPSMWGNNLEHIKAEILDLGFENAALDGEVMARNWNETSIIKKGCSAKSGYTRPSDEIMAKIRAEVQYHVFDLIDLSAVQTVENSRSKTPGRYYGKSLVERRAELQKYLVLTKVLKLVEAKEVRCQLDVDEVHAANLAAGYEGTMLKYPQSGYNFTKGKSWQKVKPKKTLEARIVEVVEGLGKYTGMMGELVCVLEDGTKVRVGTGYSDQQRKWAYDNRATLPGGFLELEVQDTEVSKIRHPSFQRFRDDKKEF